MHEKPRDSVVLSRWYAVRKSLDDAVQLYLDASITLAAAVSRPLNHFPNEASLDDAINSAQLEISQSSLREEMLGRAQVYLSKARNRSPTLISFNKLPPEIITRIFQDAAETSCDCDSSPTAFSVLSDHSPSTLLSITHVCTHWREIAINMPSLWSHVTITPNRHGHFTKITNCAQMWFDRAGDVKLYIHLAGARLSLLGFGNFDVIHRCLLPHLHKIIGLRVHPSWQTSVLNRLLPSLIEGCTSLRELVRLGDNRQWLSERLAWPGSQHPHSPAHLPSPPIRIFRLQNAYISWDHPIWLTCELLPCIITAAQHYGKCGRFFRTVPSFDSSGFVL